MQSERLKSASARVIWLFKSVLPKRLSLSIFQVCPRMAHSASFEPALEPVAPEISRLSKPSER